MGGVGSRFHRLAVTVTESPTVVEAATATKSATVRTTVAATLSVIAEREGAARFG
ncbi:hypothetical protein [Streptomyces sp. NBC_01236]|uniref:hypothetical protein n=1 Tax=Streptomyces sp. NBC_01236 TaxID=2903789 RepID=UPI002E0FD732|nr:hypothetical protein OG324_48840 [Streptomyces sp. NBC_01236]